MKRIILITGGQRSGKSVFAENMALQLSENPVYVATAHIWDDDFRRRVEIHKARRGEKWENVEEEKYLGRLQFSKRIVLVDCLTLWATNYFFSDNTCSDNSDAIKELDIEYTLNNLISEFDKFTNQDATFIFVTNELGCGGVSDNALQRRFTDLLGSLNQYVAHKADDVYMVVSGIPVKIK